jgi:hypothetical protein
VFRIHVILLRVAEDMIQALGERREEFFVTQLVDIT